LVEVDKEAEYTNSPQDAWLQHEGDLTNTLIFLLAGYARYNRPFVWVRSGKQILEPWQVKEATDGNTDAPMRLWSTSIWAEQAKSHDLAQMVASSSPNLIHAWDILYELIQVAYQSKGQIAPVNPFEIDLAFFDTLPLEESVIKSGAMISFMRSLWSRGIIQTDVVCDQDELFDHGMCFIISNCLVWDDLSKLQTKHLHDLDQILSLQRS
jgi:hypothetical protein